MSHQLIEQTLYELMENHGSNKQAMKRCRLIFLDITNNNLSVCARTDRLSEEPRRLAGDLFVDALPALPPAIAVYPAGWPATLRH